MRSDLVERFGEIHPRIPILVTIPHSGEIVPSEASWLSALPQDLLNFDIDRFVDRFFRPIGERLGIPAVMTHVHRYAADLNRYPNDVDEDSVEGSANPSGSFRSGFHWVRSMAGVRLMPKPIPPALHEEIVRKFHDPFHEEIARLHGELDARFPGRKRLHIELHSMPSVGIDGHGDAGTRRPEITVSDCEGRSCGEEFRARVMEAFQRGGFDAVLNRPYKGGRNTQRYGKPEQGKEAIQIEINRSLYMDEGTHEPLQGGFEAFQKRLDACFAQILLPEKNSV